MDGHPKRQTKKAELCGAGKEVPHGSEDSQAVRESPEKPEYTLSEPKPTKMDPYKQIVDEWLAEAPYSAVRILEKMQEQGFEEKYSIVKEYVGGKKWT